MTESIQATPSTPAQGISLLDILLIISKYKRLLILAPLIAGALALAVTLAMPNRYTSMLKIAPSKNAAVYAWLLNDESLINPVSQSLQLKTRYGSSGNDSTLKAIKRHVKIKSNAKEGSLEVEATDTDPAFAAKLANAFGQGLTRQLFEQRLLDSSKARYDLELRRDMAVDNKAKAGKLLTEPGVKEIIDRVPPAERYGIVSLAGIQAEATLQQQGISDLAQSQIVKMQDQLSSMQRLLMENMKRNSADLGKWITAVTALQDEAYWGAMKDRLDRRVDLAKAQESDELKISWAKIPDEKSSPKLMLILALAVAIAFVLALIYVVLIEAIDDSQKQKPELWGRLRGFWQR
ncbi:Wzz/FepE/Etk N-terminal domain-containing protein [Jeongeupia sp. USM3]|uniref:Wzz/FepE/Etk N-terminal domain-containing protein n=1 Tax=Jeongeupia sp. USM3 TaxID=1906741 RepID=UPI00089E01B0|nr:Wzz/FepE/Etk N-terminal domain-containing protein [Jeongeupia sp. USM3]AOY00657.1 hypothetical protein BJP62_09555 [Jeongeupia sp. USM3]